MQLVKLINLLLNLTQLGFSKLKKRRVPVDAAYKASLVLYVLTYQHYSMQLWELSMMIAKYNIKLHIYQAYFLFRPTNNNVTS